MTCFWNNQVRSKSKTTISGPHCISLLGDIKNSTCKSSLDKVIIRVIFFCNPAIVSFVLSEISVPSPIQSGSSRPPAPPCIPNI
jgi:hypothetical protein